MSERIRLLIVDDSAATRDHLTRLVGFEDDLRVVGWAASGEQALEQVGRLPIDVILLDINMPGLGGLAAAEQISERAPATAVVMMSVQNEAGSLRGAMRAGAREFLVKPFTAEELVGAIRTAHKHTRDQLDRVAALPQVQLAGGRGRAAHVISLFAPKGGVGRTTLAVNLAVAAAGMGKRTALVDASLQFGDVGVLLNLDPRSRSVADVVRELNDESADAPETTLVEHKSGVHVLLAPPSPELAENVHTDQLGQIVSRLRAAFEVLVIDAPASLSDTTLSLLDGSDVILCVLSLEITSIRNVRHFLELGERLGYPPNKVQLLLNRADAGYGIRPADVEESLGRRFSHTVVSDGRTVVSALNRGEPFVTGEPRARVSRDVVRVAQTLLAADAPAHAGSVPAQPRRALAWR